MQFIFLILAVAVIAGIWAYLFSFLKRRLLFYRKKENSKGLKVALGIVSAGILIISFINFSSLFTLGILHAIVFGMILDGIHMLIQAVTGQKRGKGYKEIPLNKVKSKELEAAEIKQKGLEPKKTGPKKAYRIWDKVYGCGLVPVILAVLVLGYGFYNMHHVVETDYTVTTEKKIGAEGLKVAMLSDLHFGTTMDAEKLEKVTKEIQKKNPDLIVLCGDLVDESTTYEEMQAAFEVLGTMESKYGTYFVYGNHDTQPYTNHKNFTKEQLQSTIEQAGIRVLEDEICEIGENVVLVGRADLGFNLEEPRLGLDELLEGVNPDSYILVLDHQPAEAGESQEAECDLQLSGHTHGGQIWPGGIVNDLAGIVNYGMEQEDAFTVIVSSGVAGWGYDIRTAYHSEWLLVNITNVD